LETCLLDAAEESGHDHLRDFILDRENIIEATVIALCPQMRAGRCFYELCGDPDPLTRSTNATLQNV
jgi:hypothetical protein